jgi:hypothetical protein
MTGTNSGDKMSDVLAELEEELAAAELEEELGAEAFIIRSVWPRRLGGRIRFRVGPLVRPEALWDQLWRRSGVFLDGATKVQARQWAQRLAHRLRGRVVSERHPIGDGLMGRWHFHVRRPDGTGTSHIFYGRAPSRDFFNRT